MPLITDDLPPPKYLLGDSAPGANDVYPLFSLWENVVTGAVWIRLRQGVIGENDVWRPLTSSLF